jgi:hypothetical protein
MKNLAEIRNGDFQNGSLECYRYANLLSYGVRVDLFILLRLRYNFRNLSFLKLVFDVA